MFNHFPISKSAPASPSPHHPTEHLLPFATHRVEHITWAPRHHSTLPNDVLPKQRIRPDENRNGNGEIWWVRVEMMLLVTGEFRSVKMDAFGHFKMVKCCKVWNFGRVEWRCWESFCKAVGDLIFSKRLQEIHRSLVGKVVNDLLMIHLKRFGRNFGETRRPTCKFILKDGNYQQTNIDILKGHANTHALL